MAAEPDRRVDAVTGEVLEPEASPSVELAHLPIPAINVADASDELLARASAWMTEQFGRLQDLGTNVSDELVARMDRRAKWTLRIGDPEGDAQYEVKTSSPTEGTRSYDAVLLDAALQGLMATDPPTIDAQGAAGALERSVTIKLRVGFDCDLEKVADALKDPAVYADVVSVEAVDVDVVTARKPVMRGIDALLKVPGTTEAIVGAENPPPASPPARKAKVIVKHKDKGRPRGKGTTG